MNLDFIIKKSAETQRESRLIEESIFLIVKNAITTPYYDGRKQSLIIATLIHHYSQ